MTAVWLWFWDALLFTLYWLEIRQEVFANLRSGNKTLIFLRNGVRFTLTPTVAVEIHNWLLSSKFIKFGFVSNPGDALPSLNSLKSGLPLWSCAFEWCHLRRLLRKAFCLAALKRIWDPGSEKFPVLFELLCKTKFAAVFINLICASAITNMTTCRVRTCSSARATSKLWQPGRGNKRTVTPMKWQDMHGVRTYTGLENSWVLGSWPGKPEVEIQERLEPTPIARKQNRAGRRSSRANGAATHCQKFLPRAESTVGRWVWHNFTRLPADCLPASDHPPFPPAELEFFGNQLHLLVWELVLAFHVCQTGTLAR